MALLQATPTAPGGFSQNPNTGEWNRMPTTPNAGGQYNLRDGQVFKQADGTFGRTYDPTNPSTMAKTILPGQISPQELQRQQLQNYIRSLGIGGSSRRFQKEGLTGAMSHIKTNDFLDALAKNNGYSYRGGNDGSPWLKQSTNLKIAQNYNPNIPLPFPLQSLMRQDVGGNVQNQQSTSTFNYSKGSLNQNQLLARLFAQYAQSGNGAMNHAFTPRLGTGSGPADNIYMQNGSPMTMIPGQNGAWNKSYGTPYNAASNPTPAMVEFNPALPRLAPTPVGGAINNPANVWSGQRIVTQPLRVG